MSIELIVAVRSPVCMKERRDAIRSTWGKAFQERGAKVIFVVSAGESSSTNWQLKEDVLYTPGTDRHRDLTNRMNWLWEYLMTNNSFTHVLVMDDDCSVNVPLFMSLKWGEEDAWGHNNGGFLSGCAVVFSRETVRKLNDNMARDDVVIGSLLTRFNVKMAHAPEFVKPWSTNLSLKETGAAINHYIRSPEKIIENHKELNCDAKVLVVLANYEYEQIAYLEQVVKELKSFERHKAHIIVNSNVPLDIEGIDFVNIVKPANNFMIPMSCRKTIWENRNDFDIFVLSACNDHLIKEYHIDKYLEYNKIIPENRTTGLLQYEQDEKGRYFPAYHANYEWDFNSLEEYGGKKFAYFNNQHQGVLILTKEQLHKIGEIHDFTDFFGTGQPTIEINGTDLMRAYNMRTRVDTDIYNSCGMKKIICISEFEECLIHHLPNIYITGGIVGEGGVPRHQFNAPESKMKNAIERLINGE